MVDILSTVNSCKHLLLKSIKITHRITVEVRSVDNPAVDNLYLDLKVNS